MSDAGVSLALFVICYLGMKPESCRGLMKS